MCGFVRFVPGYSTFVGYLPEKSFFLDFAGLGIARIYLGSVSSVVVITVSWMIIIVRTVPWVVTTVIVSKITIVVTVLVIVPGRIIPTLISLVIIGVVRWWLVITLLVWWGWPFV